MSNKTVKVSSLSLGATLQDIKEFFSFSGEIEHVEMESFNEWSQIAFVTFKDSREAEMAVLLSGSTLVDLTVTIELAPDYQLPAAASATPLEPENNPLAGAEYAFSQAEDVISSMLAKGFVLGKDAVQKAKSLDEKHQLTSTASATVSSLDRKISFTEKINAGTVLVNDKVREVDQMLQVSEKAMSAYNAAGETVSTAGSAIMKNKYVFTGVSWAADAFSRVAKAADEVGQQTKEKVDSVEEEQRRKMVEEYARGHLVDDSPSFYDSSEQDMAYESSENGQLQLRKPLVTKGFIL